MKLSILSKMTQEERDWYRDFNYAHKRDRMKIFNLKLDPNKAKELEKLLAGESRARRRDVVNQSSEKTATKGRKGNYSPEDYLKTTVEYHMEEILVQKENKIAHRVRKPEVQALVELMIDEHYYGHEIGEVVEIRGNGETLVKILTKKPPVPIRKTRIELDNPDGYVRIHYSNLKILELE